MYICENNDGRGQARQRKFTQWFDTANSTYNYFFLKLDVAFGADNEQYLTSLISRVDNPRLADIVIAYRELSADFNRGEK